MVGDCSVNVKHCGNTSNFLKHLNSCHPEEYQACIAAQNRNKRPKTSTSSRQITLPETISQSRKYPKNSLRCKQLDDALLYMITTDLQPISIVEDKGFQKFTTLLDSHYEPPSRRTITRSMLPTKYEETKKRVQQKLEEMYTVVLTTDIHVHVWSSRQGLSYCCLTAHVISAESWKLKSYALETFNFNTDHTGEQISIELTKVVNKWKPLDISCCVTDNASNMLLGIEKAGQVETIYHATRTY